jgi:hypothetical protein
VSTAWQWPHGGAPTTSSTGRLLEECACAHLGWLVPHHAAVDASQPPLLQPLHTAVGRREGGCSAGVRRIHRR